MDEREIRLVIDALDDAISRLQKEPEADVSRQVEARSLLFTKVP